MRETLGVSCSKKTVGGHVYCCGCNPTCCVCCWVSQYQGLPAFQCVLTAQLTRSSWWDCVANTTRAPLEL